jgi:hypothetical protein
LNFRVDVRNGVFHPLPHPRFSAVAKLHSLVYTSGSPGRNCCTTKRPVSGADLHLQGGVAPRIQDLPSVNKIDVTHLCDIGEKVSLLD